MFVKTSRKTFRALSSISSSAKFFVHVRFYFLTKIESLLVLVAHKIETSSGILRNNRLILLVVSNLIQFRWNEHVVFLVLCDSGTATQPGGILARYGKSGICYSRRYLRDEIEQTELQQQNTLYFLEQ